MKLISKLGGFCTGLIVVALLAITFGWVRAHEYNHEYKNVGVIGGVGYVGLMQAAGLAKFGHHVIAADVDEKKVAQLNNNGRIPIYEPGLQDIVTVALSSKNLVFTTDVAQAIRSSDVIFIAVGTPMAENGAADLSYVKSAAEAISNNLNGFKVICIKSTVPVGTGALVQSIIEKNLENKGKFAMVSNPEFLREGTAVHDFFQPDRIVLGSASARAIGIMREVYQPLIDQGCACVETDISTAELTKYASNALLAIKLSFINELSRFADATGADIRDVARGVGLDKRINPYFLQPGPGFGGSCFPKDSRALAYMGDERGVDLKVVKASLDANAIQRDYVFNKLITLVGDVHDKTIAILGLAFKANTDDIRYSPALDIAARILEHGGQIRAYDPQAMQNAAKCFPTITYCSSVVEAVTGADAVLLLTEWDEFKNLDLKKLGCFMHSHFFLDARNLIEPRDLKDAGFVFASMGRPAGRSVEASKTE